MALSGIKTYFRAQILASDSAFKEWKDGFNIENIPSTIYDKAYHLAYGSISGESLAAEHQQITINFTVSLFYKGYRDVSAGIDRAIDSAEAVLKSVQDPATRLGTTIKNVKFLSMDMQESLASNDNLILVSQTYLVTQYFCL